MALSPPFIRSLRALTLNSVAKTDRDVFFNSPKERGVREESDKSAEIGDKADNSCAPISTAEEEAGRKPDRGLSFSEWGLLRTGARKFSPGDALGGVLSVELEAKVEDKWAGPFGVVGRFVVASKLGTLLSWPPSAQNKTSM